MITDIKKDDFGMEGKLYLDIFDAECNVVIDIDASLDYARKCADMLNNLPAETVKNLEKALRIYCLTSVSENKELLQKLTFDVRTVKSMLDCIYPQTAYVDFPEDERTGIRLECECDWDNEGIMEIIFCNDEVLYVGRVSDLSPFDDSEYFIDDEKNFITKI